MAQSVGEVALDIVAGKNTLNNTIKNAMGEAQGTASSGSSGISRALGGIGNVAKAVGKTVVAGVGIASTAVIAMGKSAVSAYADSEQLVGGVETLFKNSARTVIDNASKAYTTAGMSANEYMETVTSFSASLLQSLGNDTVKASQKADMAITDMSDNANKMGSSLESIQNAYSGFSKQNFTMLDNLKLGYGGTKEEMQRLLVEAEKISGIKYDISSYSDIVDAIHVVQTEMGITGTTAKEASSTISGSISSMKGAWQNLLVGMGDDTQDFNALVGNFVASVTTVGENLLPRIEIVLGGVVKLVEGLAPKIIEKIPELLAKLVPAILNASVSLIKAFKDTGAKMITGLTGGLREKVPEFLSNALPMLVDFTANLSDNIGLMVDAGLDLIIGLCDGIIDSLPVLIANVPQIVINICSIINNNAPKLITSAVYLIGRLIVGIIKAIPTLIKNAPKIIEAIVSVITAFNWLNLGGNIVKGIADGVKNLPTTLKEFAKNAVDNIKNAFTGGGIGGVVSTVFNGIKNSISNVLNGVISFVKNAVQNLKNIFKFSWSLPHIKLPHFKVSGGKAPWGFMGQGSLPSVSVQWYRKAMDNAMLLDSATIFGYNASSGKFLGGGEAGSELVVGTNTLLNMIKSATASVLSGTKLIVDVPALQNVRAGSAGADSGLTEKMDKLIELFKQFIESGNADMTVPVYIGNELIDEYILNKSNRNMLRSGGHA